MNFLSLFSGIEAASVAFAGMGWKCVGFAEVEPTPCKILAHHYPGVPNLGDVTAEGFLERASALLPDVIVGGPPCQAFSIAGLRKSLGDARGNLTLRFVQVVEAVDAARKTAGLPPAIVMVENVTGLLNTPDNAFGCFLAALAGEDEAFDAAGGKWSNAGCVFGPERAVAWRVLDAKHFGVPQRRRRVFVVACPLERAHPTQILFECESVQGDSEPGPEHGTPEDTGRVEARAFDMLGFGQYGDGKTSSTLKARDYKDATDLVVTFVKGTNPHYAGEPETWKQTETAATLTPWDVTREPPKHVVTFPANLSGTQCVGGPADESVTLQAKNPTAITYSIRLANTGGNGCGIQPELSPTLDTSQGPAVSDGVFVRKLMPVEYERLMGFPDGYTDVAGATDSARYKALGNSWATPVVRWIGLRIQEAVL